jgi:hypothetical protein
MPRPWKLGRTAHPISKTGRSCQVRSQCPTHPIPSPPSSTTILYCRESSSSTPIAVRRPSPGSRDPDVLSHLRVVEHLEERKVLRAPRLDSRDGPVERVGLIGHASQPNLRRASPRHVIAEPGIRVPARSMGDPC